MAKATCPICEVPLQEAVEPTAEWCIDRRLSTAEAEADIVHIARMSYLDEFTGALEDELEKGDKADHAFIEYLRKEVRRLRRLLTDFRDDEEKLNERRRQTRLRVCRWRARRHARL